MKKVFTAMLALSLVLGMAACGGQEQPDTAHEDETPGTSQTEPSVQDPLEPEDEGVRQTVWVMTEAKYQDLSQGTEGSVILQVDGEGRIVRGYNDTDDDGVVEVELEYGFDTVTAVVELDGAYYETVTLTLDDMGRVIRQEYKENYGDSSFMYDENGWKIKAVTEDGWMEYDYDDDGNIVAFRRYEEDVLRMEETDTYQDGVLIREDVVVYDGEGQVSRTRVAVYDQYGNPLSDTTEYADPDQDAYILEYVYTYDDAGNVLTEDYYFRGQLADRYVYTYDEDGDRTSETLDGELKRTFTYDEKGQLIRYERYKDGAVRSATEYSYDQSGHQVGYTVYDADGVVTDSYTATYEALALTEKQLQTHEAILELLEEWEVL